MKSSQNRGVQFPIEFEPFILSHRHFQHFEALRFINKYIFMSMVSLLSTEKLYVLLFVAKTENRERVVTKEKKNQAKKNNIQ